MSIGLLEKPALGPCRMTLRPYQEEAIAAVRNEFTDGKHSTLLVLPTGCVSGNTVIGMNRCGKGYSRTIAHAFRLQNDPRVNHEFPTRIRADVGGRIGLQPIRGVVASGIKETLELRLANGRSIRATPDHEVQSDHGWLPLGDLAEGATIACEADPVTGRGRKVKPQYQVIQGLVYHPFATGVTSRVRVGRTPEGRLYRVARHRLVAEADVNRLSLSEFVAICRYDADRAATLTYIDPAVYAVHHDDRDHRNNDPRNLVVLTHEEHHRLHGQTDKLANLGSGLIEWSRVVSVRTHGYEETYDVVCDDPHRNFVGNGIVVHNCGKTVVFGSIARRTVERGGRVLVIAHRGELIEQAVNKLDELGVEAGVEKAGQRARAVFEPDVVVATVQTMQGDRLASWPSDYFRLVITDEAHHASADSYRKIYRHFAPARHLGVTATADRADETNLGDVFESVAYEMSLWDAMTAPPPGPYLCRLKFVQCDVDIDLRNIRTTAGDFNLADLEERITPLVDTLANAIRQEIGGRKTLIFTPDIGSAQAMASALVSLGLRADWASGDDKERKAKVDRLHSGDTQILCNCALLTEGFDCPDIAAIVLCRPTKSRPLYAQMVGRGTRLAQGKEDCLLVDFNYLTTKHDLVKPVELFDTTHTDSEVLKVAEELLSDKPGRDLVEAIEEAQVEQQRRQVLRVQARQRSVSYRKVSYDPLAVFDTLGIPCRGPRNSVTSRATPGQVKYLQTFGVEDAPNLSRTRAGTLIDYLSDRRNKGLATMKQCSWLIAKGVEPAVARLMTFREASKKLDSLFNRRA